MLSWFDAREQGNSGKTWLGIAWPCDSTCRRETGFGRSIALRPCCFSFSSGILGACQGRSTTTNVRLSAPCSGRSCSLGALSGIQPALLWRGERMTPEAVLKQIECPRCKDSKMLCWKCYRKAENDSLHRCGACGKFLKKREGCPVHDPDYAEEIEYDS